METLDIKILYGSETGTAQDTAEGLWKLIKRLYIYLLFNKQKYL